MTTLNHVGLTVSDLEASVAFYRDVVGMEEAGRSEVGGDWFDRLTDNVGARIRVAHLTLGGLTLQLVQYLAAGGETLALAHKHVGNPHLCFNVQDLEAARRRVEALGGGGFLSPVVSLGDTGRRSFYVADPDGVLIEFIGGPPSDRQP